MARVKIETLALAAAVASVGGGILYYLNRKRRAGKVFGLYELNRRHDPDGVYADAPADARRIVQADWPMIRAAAEIVANAPGLLADNEGAAVGAVLSMPSRFHLLWLNRMMVGTDWRTLGIFDPAQTPNLAPYLAAFCGDAGLVAIVDYYETLPKYPGAVSGGVVRSRFRPPYLANGRAAFPVRHRPGVYVIRDAAGVVRYVGFSRVDVYKALYRHFERWTDRSRPDPRAVYDRDAVTVRVLYVDTPERAAELERALIVKLAPTDNPRTLDAFALTEHGAELVTDADGAPFLPSNEMPPF